MRNEISWPKGNKIQIVKNGFEEMKGLKNVIGALDGCHIPISGRDKNNEAFVNRKQFTSIQLQACCDHQRKFTDCSTGYPGSVHDARIFANSDLKSRIDADPFTMVPGGSFILGDAAYQLENYMMTPYKDTGGFSPVQRNYNYIQSATRIVIERAFALLKGRFPRLKFLEFKNMTHLCEFILAICILHNFCIDEDLKFNDTIVDFLVEEEEEINNFIFYGSAKNDAERKRTDIANELL